MVRREIPLPLPSEAGALFGVGLGDALVLAAGVSLGAMAYAAPGHPMGAAAAVAGLAAAALVRLDHDPLWMQVGWWAWYHLSPRCFVPES